MCLLGTEESDEDHRCLALGSWAVFLQVNNHEHSQKFCFLKKPQKLSNLSLLCAAPLIEVGGVPVLTARAGHLNLLRGKKQLLE